MEMGFVMDPIEGVKVDEDTTFALMLAAQRRDWDIYYIRPEDLGAVGAQARARITPVEVRCNPENKVDYGASRDVALKQLDCVWMRKDPPFDTDYLHEAHLLELAQQEGCLVVNEPAGLRRANEKLYSLQFPQLIPDTVVTSRADQIKDFMADHDGRCVLKPLRGFGGEGVVVLDEDDRNLNSLIEISTQRETQQVMCQAYLEEAREGDKRILMLEGEPMGGILRVPPEEEHRSNIHVGGDVVQTTLTDAERHICEVVGDRLVEDGLYFVGIDVIGERLTEVNVTSPTGIQEMSRLNDVDGPGRVIEWVERWVGA